MTVATEPINTACVTAPSPLVGEEQHEHEDDDGDEEQHDPQRGRDHADGSVDPVDPGRFAVGRLVEPLSIGRLLARRPGLEPS